MSNDGTVTDSVGEIIKEMKLLARGIALSELLLREAASSEKKHEAKWPAAHVCVNAQLIKSNNRASSNYIMSPKLMAYLRINAPVLRVFQLRWEMIFTKYMLLAWVFAHVKFTFTCHESQRDKWYVTRHLLLLKANDRSLFIVVAERYK